MNLSETKRAYVSSDGVVLKINTEQDFEIKQSDLVAMIVNSGCASDTMAKLINALGKVNAEYQSTTCYAKDDLDKLGIEFINDMHYFINNEAT